METRRLRLILRAGAGLLGLGSLASAWWAWMYHPSDDVAVAVTSPRSSTLTVETAPASRTLDDFADVWSRPYQRPLVDPPPPAPVPLPKPAAPVRQAPQPVPPPAPPDPQVQLVGTIIEQGRSIAIITDQTGKIDMKGEGETLNLSPGDIRIDRIDSQEVAVTYCGHQLTLTMQKSSSAPKPKGKNRQQGR